MNSVPDSKSGAFGNNAPVCAVSELDRGSKTAANARRRTMRGWKVALGIRGGVG